MATQQPMLPPQQQQQQPVVGVGGGGGAPPAPPPMPQQQHQHQQQQPPGPPSFPPPSVPPRPEDLALHITVSDPVQHQDGINKYTSYRVDVRPPDEQPAPGQSQMSDSIFQNASYSAVLRRYSDFLWLYERLHRERAGAIVPPLPEKQAVARFTPAFVERRRSDLEVFLRRVSVHPELSDASCLDTFLRADDGTFRAAKNSKDGAAPMAMPNMMSASGYGAGAGGMASIPTAGGGVGGTADNKGLKRWFSEAKTSIAGDLVRSPDDDLFEEIESYVAGLDVQMRNVSVQAGGLVRKGKEIANGLFEFGLAFHLLGRSEADALGTALGRVGDAADSLSVLSADHAEREATEFEDPLADYVKTVHAVRLALHRRHEKRLAYTARLSELNSKQAALMKLRTTPGAEGKAYAAEMSLQRGQVAADAARDDFMAVSQRVLREVDRFKREKAEDMRRTVVGYIDMQVEYNRRMEEVWANLIPVLENVPMDAGEGVGTATADNVNAVTAGGVVGGGALDPSSGTPMQLAPPPAAAPPPVPVGQEGGAGGVGPAMTDPGLMGGGIQYRT